MEVSFLFICTTFSDMAEQVFARLQAGDLILLPKLKKRTSSNAMKQTISNDIYTKEI